MDWWVCWFPLLLRPLPLEGSDELEADGEDLDDLGEGVMGWKHEVAGEVSSLLYSRASLRFRDLVGNHGEVSSGEAFWHPTLVDESFVESVLVILGEDHVRDGCQDTLLDQLRYLLGHPWSSILPLAAWANISQRKAVGSGGYVSDIC